MPPTSVERLWGAGFPIGPRPVENCELCPHIWGRHQLHPVDDENPMAGGTWSCPECRCTATWSVGPDRQVCQWGRRLQTGEICAELATVTLVVLDHGNHFTDVGLCASHASVLERLGVSRPV